MKNPYAHIDGSIGYPKPFFVGLIMTPDGMYCPVKKIMSAGFIPTCWTAYVKFEKKNGLESWFSYTWNEGELIPWKEGYPMTDENSVVLKLVEKHIKALWDK